MNKIKWSELIEKVILKLRDEDEFSAGYIENIELGLNKHTLPLWNDFYAENILPGDVKYLIKTVLKEESTYKKRSVLKYLRKIFNVAVMRE